MSLSASTFRTDEPGLHELLSDLEKGRIQLPDFQRDWVWDDLRIRELLASLSLSYPIGAIMLMETGADGAKFKPRWVEGIAAKPGVNADQLILDGQQRMTSLYLALKSGKPVPTRTARDRKDTILRVYYLDITKSLDSSVDRLDAVRALPPERQETSNFGKTIELDLSTPELEFEQAYFPLDRMFDQARFIEWSTGFQKHFNYSPEKVQLWNRFQHDIWLRFQQYKLPVIVLLKDTPKEAVCQVFEKVNTGGVALTVFELITASFAADGFQLRVDWERRRRGIPQPSANSTTPTTVVGDPKPLTTKPVLKRVEDSDFLTAVTLLSSYKRHTAHASPVSCKRRDVLALTLPEYTSNADAVQRGMLSAAKFLVGEKIFDAKELPYSSQLIPLAVICAVLNGRMEHDVVARKVAQWYWCGVFGELYGGANESRFALDVPEVVAWIDGGFTPRTISDANFTPLRLLTLTSRLSAAYKGLYARLMDFGSHDFLSGKSIEVNSYFEWAIDIHHVFPVAHCRSLGIPQREWDSIINKVPLSYSTNRFLGGRAPSKYLAAAEHKGIAAEKLDENLGTHLIDPQALRTDDFKSFMRKRASGLLDVIEKAMGKSVSGRDADEVVQSFGAPLT